MACPACGRELGAEDRFCDACGALTTTDATNDSGEASEQRFDILTTRGGRITGFEVSDLGEEAVARRRWKELDGASHAATARSITERYLDAYNSRDWDAVLAIFAEDLVAVDHRPLGWGEVRDREAFVAIMRSGVTTAADTRLSAEFVGERADAVLFRMVMSGTSDDGASFELVRLIVFAAEGGTVVRGDSFDADADGEAAARACFTARFTGDPAKGPQDGDG